MANQVISYAQNKEDLILNALFKAKNKGFYIDVGANHPVTDSVTKLFYDKGWSGINIEPATKLFGLMLADRPRDINLQLGISNQSGNLKFREYLLGDGLSTFSKKTQSEYAKDPHYKYYASKYIDRIVPVITLSELFKTYAKNKQVDFIKIDIEGYEYEAIEGNDWNVYRPKVVCIEANHMVRDWRPILLKANYELALHDGLNDYFVAKEHTSLAKNYSYSDAVFLEGALLWSDIKKTLAHQQEVKLLQYQVTELSGSNNELWALRTRVLKPGSFKAWLRSSLVTTARAFDYYINLPTPPRKLTIDTEVMKQLSAKEVTAVVQKQIGMRTGGIKYQLRRSVRSLYTVGKRLLRRRG